MGRFEDSRDTTDDVVAGQAAVMQQDAYAAQAAASRPVDLDDPVWAPISGITLDKYAQLTAAMARQDLGTPDEAQAWLEGQGVQAGTWAEVQSGWVNRMATNEAVRTRYGILYSQS